MSEDAYTSTPVDRAAQDIREGGADAALAVAVQSYTALAGHVPPGDSMTAEVLPVLWSVITADERKTYPDRLQEFINRYQERLARLYTEYGPHSAIAQHGRHELFAHPVSLIALERLSTVRSRFALAAQWNGELPDTWLNDICGPWGIATIL
ncbi:hypothetical protein ACFWXK_31655 [Streptomyces sp. NPDC059070]|uniref:hypothetical protein n=1 Tax=Streptomyces sp. NPDC059070 TaxID=3346713 RepID=UPI003692247B